MSSSHSAITIQSPPPGSSGWARERSRPRTNVHAVAAASTATAVTMLLMILAAAGLSISLYLSWVALTSSKIAGCGSGDVFDCSHVMHTKWSGIVGVPVGVPAAILYASLLAGLFTNAAAHSASVRRAAQSVITLAVTSAAFAALWFIILQVFVVQHLCGYCLAAHACGLAAAAIVLGTGSLGKRRTILLSLVSFASVASLAVAQTLSTAPDQFQIETFTVPADGLAENSIVEEDSDVFLAPGQTEATSASEYVGDDEAGPPVFEAPVVEEAVETSAQQTANPG